MNIVHFTGMFSEKYGGLEKFFVELAQLLNSQGHKMIVVYTEFPYSEQYVKDLQDNGVDIIVINKQSNILIQCWYIRKIIKKYRPQIIHTHFDPMGYLSLAISYLMGVKKRVRSLRSMMRNQNQKEDNLELSFKTIILKKMMLKFSTDIYSVSDGIKKQYERIFDTNKIETLYMGVSKNLFDKQENKIPVITCIAFHDTVKGVDILLRALSILIEKYEYSDFILHQIGGGKKENTGQLIQLTKELQLDDYVVWMGLRDNAPELLAQSDVYCQPSRSEGISMAIMEASMASLPTIGANVGGIPEAVEDNVTGLLFEAENVEQLANRLFTLLSNKDLRIKMGNNAKQKAMDKFCLEKQADCLVQKYTISHYL